MRTSNKTRNYLLIAAFLQLVWGFVPTASKFVIDEIPVELYIAIRWTISGFIFASYLFIKKKWQKIDVKDVFWISLLGVMGYGIASLGTLYGLKIGGIINFALVGAVGPVISSLISVWILNERPQRLFYVALPISVLGLLLLAIGKYQISSKAIAGMSVGFILGACILEAFVFVFSKKFKSKVSVIQYLAIAQIAAAVLMWILQGAVFHQIRELVHMSEKGIFAALFVSIVACLLCYAVLYWLLNYVDGHRLALFDGFHTLSATIFGFIIFKESLSLLMLIGGCFILIGLIIGNLPRHLVEEKPDL